MLEYSIDVDNLSFRSEDKTLRDVGMEVHETPRYAPDYIGFSRENGTGFVHGDSIFVINDGSSYEIHIKPKEEVLSEEQISVCLETACNYIRGIRLSHRIKPAVKLIVYDEIVGSLNKDITSIIDRMPNVTKSSN